MLRDSGFMYVFFINLLYILLWHLICFILCISIKTSFFDENKRFYKIFDFEKDGRIYTDKLKIKKWKDLLPQYIGKKGFSKRHITSVSEEYIDYFIMETCRGEWDHRMNCLYFIISFIINPFFVGLFFSFSVILINLPFIIIQRYNRCRLQKVRQHLNKKSKNTRG